MEQVTRYDRDYIWGPVHDQLRQVGLSQAASDYAMIHFDHRYKYALEHMRFAARAETIAEYVFNGILAEWTKGQRLNELKGWILLGILGLGMIWLIIEVITAPEMEDHY